MPLDFIVDTAEKFCRSDRFFNSRSAEETCRTAEHIMREIGMEKVETLHFVSDGKISHGGWVMPLAWFPETAVLSEVSADGSETQICSYCQQPCSLMMYSQSADLTAELTDADAADVSGKIVLVTDHFISIPESERLLKRGAVGIISSFLDGNYIGKPGWEYLDDVCQWCNYQLPFHQGGAKGFGFSISPRQGRALQKRLEAGEKIRLHAAVKAELRPGTLPLVTGVLPGESDEEILLAAHLFEQGANDNAAGAAAALAVVRALAGTKHRRSIRVMLTNEIKSLQAYVNTVNHLPDIKGGINLDMIGVSSSFCAVLGPSAPGFPHFAVPFLASLFQKRGCSLKINPTAGMDTVFCDPFLKVPMSFVEFMDDPDYHHSSDTPDKLNRDVLKLSFETALEFTAFLADAGAAEALELAETAGRMDRFMPHLPDENPAFAREVLTKTVLSVLTLTDEQEKTEVQKSLETVIAHYSCGYDGEKNSGYAELPAKWADVYPCKNFQGLFSFEKYWLSGTLPENIAAAAGGWHAAAWIELCFMWADGTRTVAEIYKKLTDCGMKIGITLFCDMTAFLLEENFLVNRKL